MDNKYITLSHLDQTVWSLVQKINQIKDSIKIEETDPVFLASAASQITSGDIQQWNGLLASPAASISQTNLTDWNNAAQVISNNNYMVKGTDYVTAGQRSGTTLGSRATAEGYDTTAIGSCSHTEGVHVISIGEYSHAEGGSTTFATLLAVTGSGTSYTTTSNLYYYYLGKQITYDNIQTYITSIDEQNKAFMIETTFGTLNNAQCIVYGMGCSSLGGSSHAEGYGTTSQGSYSHAEGSNTISEGAWSHAEGSITIAKGSNSHAEGVYTTSIGAYSHAEGGDGAIAYLTLTGSGTSYTTTNILRSYYLGKQIKYNGISTYITSIDVNNKTITVNTTFGELSSASCTFYPYGSSAFGVGSHAEGYGTIAQGEYSHTEGQCTIASGSYQHAAGKYNIEDTNNTYAEIIGIGTAYDARTNGRTLDWSGNEVLAGKLTVGAGPTADMDVATKLYVDTLITVEPMSNVQAMLTELGLDADASLTPATVPAQTNHAIVQEG